MRGHAMATNNSKPGTLIAIGGHERDAGDRAVLSEVARRVDGGKLVIATVASSTNGKSLFDEYEGIFRRLGVKHVYRLEVESRDEARAPAALRVFEDASA